MGVETYNDPALMLSSTGVSESDAETAYRLDKTHNLQARGTWNETHADLGVRWLPGDLNQHENSWYIIRPNGDFLAWDGTPREAGGTKLAELTTDYFNDPVLLTNAVRPGTTASPEALVRDAFGIASVESSPTRVADCASFVWFIETSSQFGNTIYFVSTVGDVTAWNGTATASGKIVAQVSPGFLLIRHF